MATIFKELLPAKIMEASNTTQYTAVGCTAIISKCTVTNTGAANANFSVYLANGGDGLSEANRIIKERYLAPGEVYTCPEIAGHMLDRDSYIATSCSAASTFTVRLSGREITR